MNNKKKTIITAVIASVIFIMIALFIIGAITESFILDSVVYILCRLLVIPAITYIIHKCFSKEFFKSKKKVLILCSSSLLIDAILSSLRYVLSRGSFDLMFFSIGIPLCFIVTMYYACKDNNRSSKELNISMTIGVILLLISLFFEISSFVDIIYGG